VPTLTYYLLIAALAVLTLLVVNAIVYRRRHGTFLRPEKRRGQRQPLARSELWLSLFMVLGLLVGVAVPTLAPSSSFAVWLSQPYSHLAYFAWCILATIVASVALSVRSLLHERRGHAS
jgi:hypothetical protein